MNGIENITGRILADAREKAEAILDEARKQAAEIAESYAEDARRIRREAEEAAARDAARQEERMAGAAALEGRKLLLRAKQELLEETFDLAVHRLHEQPREAYTAFLTDLLTQAASTGREEVILCPVDRAQVGKEVVTAANERLAKAVAPQLPQELKQGRLGAALDKAVTAVGAIAQGTAMLTLSQETRDIQGGFILSDGPVEVNCALETLVRQQRDRLSGEVARILFPQ